MDVYFSRPRVREHLPTHIAGVQRLGKNECIDDIESIKLSTRLIPLSHSNDSTDVALASEVVPSNITNNNNIPFASAMTTNNNIPSAVPLNTNNNINTAATTNTRTRRQYNNLSSASIPHILHHRINDELTNHNMSLIASRKRQRLESRVLSERHELDDILKLSLTELRGELDLLRNECVSYEEAISSSRREIELAKREKQELEEQFSALKGEYELSVATTETARADEEKAEIELRDRLAEATQIAADAQGRVDQLQLIETEFKTKDLTITHLREDVNKLNMEIQHLRNALQNKPFTITTDSNPSNTTQSQSQPSPSSPSVNGSATDKLLQHVIDNTAKQSSALTQSMYQSGVNINQNQTGITTAAKAGVNGILMVTGDFIRYVQVHNERIANSQKTIKTLQTERDHLAIQVQEREQLLHTQYAQIERITKFNADLQSTVKVSSALLHDERLKHEHTLKQMKLIQQQYDDTIELCELYHNKVNAYDNVLQISDNRAIQAELGLHDNIHQIKTYRNGMKSLQLCYNRLLQQHVMLQKYHANICDLILSTQGDSIDNETRELFDSQNMSNTTPNTSHTSSRTKKQLNQHSDGYQLETYESIQDYKKLFHKMSDIIQNKLHMNQHRINNNITPTAFTLDTPPSSDDKQSNGTSHVDSVNTAQSVPTEQNGVLKFQTFNQDELQQLKEVTMPNK